MPRAHICGMDVDGNVPSAMSLRTAGGPKNAVRRDATTCARCRVELHWLELQLVLLEDENEGEGKEKD